MNTEEAIKKLDELELKEFCYGHAMGMLHYDGDTTGPKESRIPRGKTLPFLAGEARKLSTSKEALELIDTLKERMDELSPRDRRRVELRVKSLKELQRIPVEEFVAYVALRNDSSAVWHEAKEKSDYAMFAPYLEKMIATKKRFAHLVEPDMDPYDYLLDKYEDGLTTEKCDAFFSTLRERLVPLIAKVRECPEPDTSCAHVPFPVEDQRKLSDRVMEVIGLPRGRCTIGETEHPFTTNFSKYDVRITTNYKENSYLSSFFSVVHEGGHALYELGGADDVQFTSLSGGVTMAVHESQSRFYENIIGRSRGFIEYLYPDFVKLCPAIGEYPAEDVFRAANYVTPSLIRTEADEVTYALHIMVRYELEKRFIRGDVDVAELPGMWNALYKEYLGVDVPDDRRGILQDSHWSGGMIGYFPSYALGSAYGAQLLAKMKETVDVDGAIKRGELAPISKWLEERIWRFGSLVAPGKLMEDAFGGPFDPAYYVDYLCGKVREVYGV